MSLRSIEYITKTDYIRDDYSHDVKSVNDKDIDNYFKLKVSYFEELNKFNQDKVKKITSVIYNDGESNQSVTTTYPMIFKEEDGKYIINVIDDESPHNVLYSKSISIDKSVNIINRLSEIKEAIKNNNYIIKKFDLFNKLEGLRRNRLENDILRTENFISENEKHERNRLMEEETDEISKQYSDLKLKNSNLNIEYNVLNDLLNQFIENKIKKYSTYSIDFICEDNNSKQIFTQLIKLVKSDGDQGEIVSKLREYVKQQLIINQSGTNLPGDLVMFQDEDGSEQLGTLRSDITMGATEKVMIETTNQDIKEILFSDVKTVKSLHNLIRSVSMDTNRYTITQSQYQEQLLKVYPEKGNIISSYSREIDISDNSDGNLVKSGKINYMYAYQGKQKTKVSNILKIKGSTKKSVLAKDLKSSINIIDEELLYNNEDIFMFYSSSADSKPGKGTKEEITSSSDYSELDVTKDWRKQLSNFHMEKDSKDDIIPIIIDGIPFASVEHYFHFSKYWNIPMYQGAKRAQYNDYAMKFTFNYKGDDGWGKLDASKAKMMGGKIHGLPHRPDWFKPIKGINKDTLKTEQLGGGNFITLRDYVLLKGIYAKFSQSDNLKQTLINTQNAKLIHPIGGSPRKNQYEVAFHLLFTRYLIKNSLKLFNYDKYEDDLNKVNKGIYFLLSKLIIESKIDLNKITLKETIKILSTSFRYSILWKKNIVKEFLFKYARNEIRLEDYISKKHEPDKKPEIITKPPEMIKRTQSETSLPKQQETDEITKPEIKRSMSEPKISDKESLISKSEPKSLVINVEEKPEIKDDVKVIQLDKKHKSKDTQEAKKIVSSEDEDQLPEEPEDERAAESKSQSSESKLSQSKSSEMKKSVEQPKLPRSESSEMKQAIEESIKSNHELLQEIENLNQFVEESDKNIYSVPADGNCGYYSIVEMMAIENIHPLNFSEEGEALQYSRKRVTKKISFGEEDKYGEMLNDAMLELRRDVAMKFYNNFKVGEVQDESIESIKVAIANTYGSTGKYTQEIHDSYTESIRNSSVDSPKIGEWITDIELGLISSMFNIDIKVYTSFRTINLYSAEKYKELYPGKPNRNMGAKAKTIELGYYSNYHYVGVINKGFEQPNFETIIYHTITLEVGDETYELAIDLNKTSDSEFQVIPLGLYDIDTHKIKYLSRKDSIREALFAEFSKFSERHEINSETITNESLFTRINYYKDINTGKVFRSATSDSEELGVIKVHKLSGGKTYSKIKFSK